MFKTLTDKIKRDPDYPQRAWEMDVLRRVLDGTIYNVLSKEFHEELNGAQEYVPLHDRRPSVRYNLCRLVVEDSVALLFSEGHFPTLECTAPDVRAALLALVKETRLARVMTDAAICGSVGSSAVLMRVLKNRLFFEPMPTGYLTPEWQPDAPDTLLRVTEKYKVPRAELEAKGYALKSDDTIWWFQRSWDDAHENWYLPWPAGKEDAGPVLDTDRTVAHRLGFVPMVWMRNLPGPSATGAPCDGACTFRAAIESQIEIEFQLSQAGRGLKYSSDPTLLIKEPTFGDQGQFVRSASNAILTSTAGDAKLLEINGTASQAVIEYCRALREMALETTHGNRSNADKLSAAQSGRAMELMHHALIHLSDHLRQSYGEDGLLPLIRFVMVVSRQMQLLTARGKKFPQIADDVDVSLKWPPWFQPTGTDRVEEANGLATLRVAGLMSRETGVKATAETWDIEDVQHELAMIASDEKAIIAGDQLPPTGRMKQTGPGPNGNQGKGGDTPPPK